MIKRWTREHTKEWIIQLENRLEDIDYYLKRTVEWCENNGIWDDEHVFILSFMTILWVSNMREESVTKKEIFELVGIEGWEETIDQEYQLGKEYQNLDFEEMLNFVVSKL
jgi:hypothetical protein